MKKRIVFCLVCLLSFNLFAKVSWELGIKTGLDCSYTHMDIPVNKVDYLDFSYSVGADITFCLSRFIGLNTTISSLNPITCISMVNGQPIPYDSK